MPNAKEIEICCSTGHFFRRKGRAFLFDAARRVYRALDHADEAAVQTMLTDSAACATTNALRSHEKITEAGADLSPLSRRDFSDDFNPRLAPLDPNRPYEVSVQLSYRCNLRCRYCFTDHFGRRGSSAEMSEEVMRQTARFIGKRNRAHPKQAIGYVGVMGEATLYLDLVERFRRALEDEGKTCGFPISCLLTNSNLTTIRDRQALCRLKGLVGETSLDGPPEAHDALRVYPDGRGTYDEVRRGLELARAVGLNPGASAVVSALYPDVSEVYFHLFDLGFTGMCVKLVRARPDQPHYLGHRLEAICAGYDRLVDRLLALPDEQLQTRLDQFVTAWEGWDHFGRFLLRVARRQLLARRCEAWLNYASVDTDGRLYACEGLTGVPEAILGSAWEGVDEARAREMAERLHVSHRQPCRQCWARFLCGGGCMHQSWLTHRDFVRPDPAECALNRHLIELAIWFHAELARARPAVLARLMAPPKRGAYT